jgi:hypothetical protein
MNTKKIIAGLAIAGGLAAGAVGVSSGVANADPRQGPGTVAVDWHHGHGWGGGPRWNGGPGWGGPGPVGWAAPPPPPLCLFNLCV